MRGIYTAIVTPFKRNGELDLGAYRALLKDQIAAGISGIVACGTTGETPTLSESEKKLVIETTIKELKGTGVKIFAGTGSNNTAESVRFSKWASDAGVDGILVVTPYYNKPTQAGMLAHFRAVADAVSCEVMLYNVPGRTAVSLAADTISELAAHPRIRSVKEATGNPAFSDELVAALKRAGKKMDLFSGDDSTFLALLDRGATGVVSVASNLLPRAMVALQRAAEKGDLTKARELNEKYSPLFRDLFVESNPVPVKYALAALGVCEPTVRLPLVELSRESAAKLSESLRDCGIQKGQKA
jgi:4-hydroxy-tetrahydrodipicolinate synthase